MTNNSQAKFKSKNPNYFKEYYKKNKAVFQQRNRNRPSTRRYFYVIEIDGKKYCFKQKSNILIQRMNIEQLKKEQCIMVNSV